MADYSDAPTVYPVLRYRDPAEAMTGLCEAFGLALFSVARSPHGHVVHAELAWGRDLIMLGPHGGPEWLPTGAACVYLAVEDPDADHASGRRRRRRDRHETNRPELCVAGVFGP
jgi:uncharacterized glyoxalase superfamily protein PhnB